MSFLIAAPIMKALELLYPTVVLTAIAPVKINGAFKFFDWHLRQERLWFGASCRSVRLHFWAPDFQKLPRFKSGAGVLNVGCPLSIKKFSSLCAKQE